MECALTLNTFDYIMMGTVGIILVGFLYQVYKDYAWKHTWWVCEGCKQDCHASSTFGNILDKRRNWDCYHCKSRNYTFKKSLERH